MLPPFVFVVPDPKRHAASPGYAKDCSLINVKIGEGDTAVGSSIGVRQGACEGPVLFLFIMQAALKMVDWPVTRSSFRTRADGMALGERLNR